MDFSTDLLRVLWHELGHFCVDIIATDENNAYNIDRFYVSFHEAAISEEKWAGAVRTMPAVAFDKLVDDPNKTAFALISLISGCIFQTTFYNEINEQDLKLNACFGLGKNCAGLRDLNYFNRIGEEYRKKYGNREDFTMYINRDLAELYQDIITKNKNFLFQLNKLAVRERDIILKKFNAAENKEDFYHHNDMDSIKNLRDAVSEILKGAGLYKSIKNLQEQVQKAIEEDIAAAE